MALIWTCRNGSCFAEKRGELCPHGGCIVSDADALLTKAAMTTPRASQTPILTAVERRERQWMARGVMSERIATLESRYVTQRSVSPLTFESCWCSIAPGGERMKIPSAFVTSAVHRHGRKILDSPDSLRLAYLSWLQTEVA